MKMKEFGTRGASLAWIRQWEGKNPLDEKVRMVSDSGNLNNKFAIIHKNKSVLLNID